MTELRVNGRVLRLYCQIDIYLKYDSLSDKFNATFYFNPNNKDDRETFMPLTYQTCTIYHGGVLVLTGTMLSHSFPVAGDPPKQCVAVSGYSITGILEDCDMGLVSSLTVGNGSNMFDNMALEDITKLICKIWPLEVEVDPELRKDSRFTTPYANTTIKQDQTIFEFLDELCTQRMVVLSHTRDGKVLLTRHKSDKILTATNTYVKVDQVPIGKPGIAGAPSFTTVAGTKTTSANRPILGHFAPGTARLVNMVLTTDGAKLHSVIQIVAEADSDNGAESEVVNPYVDDRANNLTGPTGALFKAGVRFRREVQTAGDENDTPLTARAVLNGELKSAIKLIVVVQGWTWGGNLIMPNQLITAMDPDQGLYKPTKFFIQEVHLCSSPNEDDVAVMTCTIPEAFSLEKIVNIFT